MKKLILSALSLIVIVACTEAPKRYTQQSPEIDIVKGIIANYNAKNYDTSAFADSSKTHFNSKDKFMTTAEAMEYHKANDANYSSREFLAEDQEFEMVTTDDGETWVNSWLDWRGTMAGNGKVINIPVHLTFRFVDGKIVREVGMWDPTEVVLNLQAIEAEKNMLAEAEAAAATKK